jgi:glycosyltransferase involved in cell wall biosynthesis
LVSNIPRLIHVVWLSSRVLPPEVQARVDTWRRLNPSFEVKHWSLEDVDLSESRFATEAIKYKKWAFVCDYVRLKILYSNGGIYLDSDVEVRSSFEPYIGVGGFISWELSYILGPHTIGAVQGHPIIGDWLNAVKDRVFEVRPYELDCTPLPNVITRESALRHGLRLSGATQSLRNRFHVYPANRFTINLGDGGNICEHLYSGAWLETPKPLFYNAVREHQRKLPACIYSTKAGVRGSIQNYYRHTKNVRFLFPENHRLTRPLPLPIGFLKKISKSNRALERAKRHKEPPVPSHLHHCAPFKRAVATPYAGQLVSLIVPIFNMEPYLMRCVDSIRRQTHNSIEVILVDDGSTDRSANICNTIVELDARFRYVYKENGGLGSARNFGLELASGEYVAFIDSDDYIEPTYVEALLTTILAGHDIAVCDYRACLNDGRTLDEKKISIDFGERDPKKHLLISAADCYAWNKLYRSELFRNNRYRFSNTWFEDLSIVPGLIAGCYSIGFANKILYNYVQRADSIMSQSSVYSPRIEDIFSAYQLLSEKIELIGNHYGDVHRNWKIPLHLFTYRLDALMAAGSNGEKLTAWTSFSRKLNAVLPGWHDLPAMTHFLNSQQGKRRSVRKLLVRCFARGEFDPLLFQGSLKW